MKPRHDLLSPNYRRRLAERITAAGEWLGIDMRTACHLYAMAGAVVLRKERGLEAVVNAGFGQACIGFDEGGPLVLDFLKTDGNALSIESGEYHAWTVVKRGNRYALLDLSTCQLKARAARIGREIDHDGAPFYREIVGTSYGHAKPTKVGESVLSADDALTANINRPGRDWPKAIEIARVAMQLANEERAA